MIRARRIVHNLPSGYDPASTKLEHGDDIAFLVGAYNQAGTLLKRRVLPFWIFTEDAAGGTVIQLFEKLSPFIEFRRKGIPGMLDSNPLYAKGFEYVYLRITTRSSRGR